MVSPNGVDFYLGGYETEEAPQDDLKPGDPQIAALSQYLSNNIHLDNSGLVVDYGSGRGLLGKVMDLVWKDRSCPHYVGVDFDRRLEALSLPWRVHNHSTKLTVEDFYSSFLPQRGRSIDLIIMRNVLHEMSILDTARLFSSFTQYVDSKTELYIQDMVNLPRAERGRAGWDPIALQSFITEIGMNCEYFPQVSYGGVEWFALTVHLGGGGRSTEEVASACTRARKQQQESLLSELARLKDDGDIARLIALNNDVASIQVQVFEFERSIHGVTAAGTKPLQSVGIETFLTSTFGPFDYAVPVAGDVQVKSGLIAILAHKRLIDLEKLIRSCTTSASFVGYSQRSLFRNAGIAAAIRETVVKGKSVKILISAPDSQSVKLRAREPLYTDERQLEQDISATILHAREFDREVQQEVNSKLIREFFDVRLTNRVPSASYFFVDDLCFFSLYSRTISGSRGSCFVLKHSVEAANSYFNALNEEFRHTWDEATSILD